MDGDTLMTIITTDDVYGYVHDVTHCLLCNSCGEFGCCQHSCHHCDPSFDINDLLPYMEDGDWYTYTDSFGEDKTWVKGED